jgi:Bacterial archaeo-eukaryotic release factor family 7
MADPRAIGDIDLVDEPTLLRLAGRHRSPCVSILLPTHTAGAETRQDPVRLANLARSAETALFEHGGLSGRDADLALAPVRELLDDSSFWRHQSHGLALYAADGACAAFRVPLPLAEECFVGSTFRLRPLLPLVVGDGLFFVLALSQNEVRLFEGTRFTIAELSLGTIPSNMADALAHEDPEASLQVRSVGQAGMFHGHGVGGEVDKQTLERFFRSVDRGVRDRLGCSPQPLVLACVRYYLPIYRAVTAYTVAEDCIEGNPERRAGRDLHERGWDIVAPRFAAARDGAEARLHEATGSGRAALGVAAVMAAAASRRVATLLLHGPDPCWGRADVGGRVEIHETYQPGDEDLVEAAALATLSAGAEVYLDSPAVPEAERVAAVLRW